ncbi:hypothetical protein ARSEF1564_004244 [Beauveria bassiana]
MKLLQLAFATLAVMALAAPQKPSRQETRVDMSCEPTSPGNQRSDHG